MRKLVYLFIPLVACGYKPSQELLTARNAYDAAAQSQAASLSPAELHEAKMALQRAERFDREDQGSDRAKDQAYIAVRKAEWAQAKAATAASKQQLAQAERRYVEEQAAMLSRTRGQLSAAQQTQEKQGEALVAQSRELQSERQKTAEAQALAQQAESRAKEAMDKLSALEKVSSDARGQVITLSSALLFKSNSSVLLPAAHARLEKVADALKKVPEREFLIEGHTDSIGGEQKNVSLSERRAKSVKDYLVSRGVDEGRIRVVGAGKSRPVADNSSAEGRAMNRRVEIVVMRPEAETAGK